MDPSGRFSCCSCRSCCLQRSRTSGVVSTTPARVFACASWRWVVLDRWQIPTVVITYATTFPTLLILLLLTGSFAVCHCLSVTQIENVPTTDLDERFHVLYLLITRRFVIVVNTDPAEWRRVHWSQVVQVELARLNSCDDIARGNGNRCLVLFSWCSVSWASASGPWRWQLSNVHSSSMTRFASFAWFRLSVDFGFSESDRFSRLGLFPWRSVKDYSFCARSSNESDWRYDHYWWCARLIDLLTSTIKRPLSIFSG